MKGVKVFLSALALTAAWVLFFSGCEITTSTHDCGNNICESSESCSTCPEDCGACAVCGNNICESSESCSTCPADCGACATCGDGTCDASESCSTCPADCGACPTCGDGTCDASETCATCPADCGACPTCGDGTCDATETCATCPADCGACPICGDGTCDATESCETCPEDCGACTDEATVSFAWYIHGVQGGVDVGWGSGEAQEVCVLVQDLSGLSAPPVVQLWLEETGDEIADTRVDFNCSAGIGTTDPFWEAGETIKYAFALVDGSGDLISQSEAWETTVLAAGDNDFGEVNFYIGDYGPLGVEIQWADKIADPAFAPDCDFPPSSVATMGYLLCWGPLSGGNCPAGNLYDEIDIDVDPITCRTELAWDITDYGTYTLVLDGEDSYGTTVWGSECQDLVVDSMDPASNEFICLVLMTMAP